MLTRWMVVVSVVLMLARCGGGGNGGSGGMQPTDVGNGGHSVRFGSKVYLLDLFETGKHESNILNGELSTPTEQRIYERLNQTLTAGRFPTRELAKSLARIYSLDAMPANVLLHAYEVHQWTFTDQELLPLRVEGQIVNLNGGKLIVAANRRGRTVHISQPAWNDMDGTNRAGLMQHEVVYSLVPPKSVNVYDIGAGVQDVKRVRELTALLLFPPGSISNAFSTGELPHLRSYDQRMKVASTLGAKNVFFHKDEFFGSVDGVVGPAQLIVRLEKGGHFSAGQFVPGMSVGDKSQNIEKFCQEFSRAPFGFAIDAILSFETRGLATENTVVELKVVDFNKGSEINSYIQHKTAFFEKSFKMNKPPFVQTIESSRGNYNVCVDQMKANIDSLLRTLFPLEAI